MNYWSRYRNMETAVSVATKSFVSGEVPAFRSKHNLHTPVNNRSQRAPPTNPRQKTLFKLYTNSRNFLFFFIPVSSGITNGGMLPALRVKRSLLPQSFLFILSNFLRSWKKNWWKIYNSCFQIKKKTSSAFIIFTPTIRCNFSPRCKHVNCEWIKLNYKYNFMQHRWVL